MALSRRSFLTSLLKGAAVTSVAPNLLLPNDPDFERWLTPKRYWPGWSAPTYNYRYQFLGPTSGPLFVNQSACITLCVGGRKFAGNIIDRDHGVVEFQLPQIPPGNPRSEVRMDFKKLQLNLGPESGPGSEPGALTLMVTVPTPYDMRLLPHEGFRTS